MITMKKKLIEMSEDLFIEISNKAKENDRSVNKQIVFILKQSSKKK
jgi:hypothetical protein